MTETFDVEEYFQNLKSFDEVRNLFPITNKFIFLDSAYYSHYSLETNRRLKNFINDFTNNYLNLSIYIRNLSSRLKEKIGNLIATNKKNIIITNNTTHGLNIFAHGIRMSKGDVVTFADTEFPAVAYPWLNIERLKDIRIVMIPSTKGKVSLKDVEKTVYENNAKVLTISSVGFLGYRNDLEEIKRVCKENDCYFVVDAIQSMGICPINVEDLKIDFLAAGSQKWMMSPSGVGFSYISPEIREKIEPTFIGTMSIKYDFENFLNYKLDFSDDGAAYENSTLNCLGMIGMECAIDMFQKLGVENIFSYIIKLLDIFIFELDKSKYRIESDLSAKHRSNILIFSHINFDMNKIIQKYLESNKIYISLREGLLRISPHIFNNEQDIHLLVKALNKFNS